MRTWTLCLGLLFASPLTSAYAGPSDRHFSRDFEIFAEDGELGAIEFDNGSTPLFDRLIERKRTGARFAWGSETSRGFFHVFGERMDFTSTMQADLIGIGGGVMGSPVLGTASDAGIDFILPWRADVSLVGGEVETGPGAGDVVYGEVHGDIGFGIDWQGLRPSVGLGLSSLSGAVLYDSATIDDDLSGFNAGVFFDVRYKHPEFPMYAHLRVQSGDYEVTTFGIGAKF